MIDFYRGSRSFFRKRVQRYDLFLNRQNIPGIFFEKIRFFLKKDGSYGSYGSYGSGWELWKGGKGAMEQQHCCWESLRDYSFVKLKLQPSQTELLFRSVDDSFIAHFAHVQRKTEKNLFFKVNSLTLQHVLVRIHQQQHPAPAIRRAVQHPLR